MTQKQKEVKYIIENLRKKNRKPEELATATTKQNLHKTYKLLMENPEMPVKELMEKLETTQESE